MTLGSAHPPSDNRLEGPPARHRRGGVFSDVALRRVLYALLIVAICEVVGAVGFHLLEGFNWVNCVYEESMLATGQGPTLALTHDSSKLFASIMGFVSVGSTFSSITLAIAPWLVRIWHEARVSAERDVRKLEEELSERLHHAKEGHSPPAAGQAPDHRPPFDGPGGS